jgi:hypothetical protein
LVSFPFCDWLSCVRLFEEDDDGRPGDDKRVLLVLTLRTSLWLLESPIWCLDFCGGFAFFSLVKNDKSELCRRAGSISSRIEHASVGRLEIL